jgi:hypothetical protein
MDATTPLPIQVEMRNMDASVETKLPPRRRAVRDEVTQRRQAVALVRPFAQQIGEWQGQVARLTGSSERAGNHPEMAAGLDQELRTLEAIIRSELQAFTGQYASWPKAIRSHSRVMDTLRAIDSVLAALERAKRAISAGGAARL